MKHWVAVFWSLRHWMLSCWLLLIPVRIYEIIQLSRSEFLETSLVWNGVYGFFYDAWLVLLCWFLFTTLLLPFLFLSDRINRILAPILVMLVLFLNIGLVEYFLTMNQALDESVFYFSLDELKLIVGFESRINVWVITAFVALFGLLFFLHSIFRKRAFYSSDRARKVSVTVVLLGVVCSPFARYFNTDDTAKQAVVNNKIIYFADESLRFAFEESPLQSEVRFDQFTSLDPSFYNDGKVDQQYPTFHELPGKSVLTPLLNKTGGKAPNIVFIVVESLSSDLVGTRADKTGHLMPFVDSLSKKSLYFPNFLSTAQRTHNVLPATLCSVPNVIDGNVFQQIHYPDHWSLLSLLKPYYRTRFYCGVFLEYINMRGFMNYQKVDAISDRWLPEIQAHSDAVGSPWGYPDGDLFTQAAADDSLIPLNGKSRLDVYLTISTHDPFVYPDKERYTRLVKRKVGKLKSSFIKRDLLKKADKMGSYCYTDDQLRAFFKKEQQKPDFQNTIYLLTGDHGTEQCYYDPVSKFKVPLIIYSPLLRAPKQIDNVATHLDVAPTLINYLRLNYLHQLPPKVPFIGKELDTRSGFHTDRSLVFTSSQLKTEELFQNGVFLVDGKLFKVDRRLSPVACKDAVLLKKMKQQLGWYSLFSQYTINQNHLVPPVYQAQFIGVKHWIKRETNFVYPKKQTWQEKFIQLGATGLIAGGKESIRIQAVANVYCNKAEDLAQLPDLVVALEPLKWLRKESVLYKGVRPILTEAFRPKSKNKVVYTVEFDPKNMDRLSDQKQLLLYLYNPKKQSVPIYQIETVISTSKNN